MEGATDRFNFSIVSFTPALEREFQANYYAANRQILRLAAVWMVAVLSLVLLLSRSTPTPFDLLLNTPQIGFWALLFGLTFWRGFERIWPIMTPLLAGAIVIFTLDVLAKSLVTTLG